MEEKRTNGTEQLADLVFNGLTKIRNLENARDLIETSDTLLFTKPGREGKEIVTLENGEDTKPIIDVAKELALRYIDGKISVLKEAVFPHLT